MPPGNKTGQLGAAFPITAEAEIRPESSGIDVITITGHSSMSTAADFLVLRGSLPEGSTRTDSELFVVGSSGELRTYSKRVVDHTTVTEANATAITLAATNSGQIHTVGTFSSGAIVYLPAPALGRLITIVQNAGMTSGAVLVSATNAGDYDILFPNRASAVSTAALVAPASTLAGHSCLFLGVSTARWLAFANLHGIEGASGAAELAGAWTSVST